MNPYGPDPDPDLEPASRWPGSTLWLLVVAVVALVLAVGYVASPELAAGTRIPAAFLQR